MPLHLHLVDLEFGGVVGHIEPRGLGVGDRPADQHGVVVENVDPDLVPAFVEQFEIVVGGKQCHGAEHRTCAAAATGAPASPATV